jgi:hypothetical protein
MITRKVAAHAGRVPSGGAARTRLQAGVHIGCLRGNHEGEPAAIVGRLWTLSRAEACVVDLSCTAFIDSSEPQRLKAIASRLGAPGAAIAAASTNPRDRDRAGPSEPDGRGRIQGVLVAGTAAPHTTPRARSSQRPPRPFPAWSV